MAVRFTYHTFRGLPVRATSRYVYTMKKQFYRRRLPHWMPPNAVFDLCFRLNDTLPHKVWKALKEERDRKLKELKLIIPDKTERKERLHTEHARYFGKYDELLDAGSYGPTWLKQPEVAEVVIEAFHYRHEQKIFKLICFSIMPNHVHALIYKTQQPLTQILASLKTRTARQANIVLDRTGQTFWHPEGYDHVVRNRGSLRFKINYHLNNPVKAGLCKHWSKWAFNFIHPDFLGWVDT